MATRKPVRRKVYRVLFRNEARLFEIYVKSVSQGGLFGFIEIEGLLFGQKSSVVVDPSEDALKREFEGVERCYVPMHAVVRIDEVEQRGQARIHPAGDSGKVTSLPSPIYTPVKKE